MYDIAIIGAGITGCAIAMELSKYKLNICVIEKRLDVCEGTSKANTGIVNAGFDPVPGTLCAKLNARGAEMIREMALDLGYYYKPVPTMVVAGSPEQVPELERLYRQGKINGVKDLSLLNREEAHEEEPALADNVCGALLVKSAGIVCPFSLTIAYAEIAAMNGTKFRFGEAVSGIRKIDSGFEIETSKGMISTRYVVNAAGLYADVIHNMVSSRKIRIIPRKGEYCLLDKIPADFLRHTVFEAPSKMGKGVVVSPTVHGNLIVGPTSVNIDDKTDTSVTQDGIDHVITHSAKTVKSIPYLTVITQFAGLRAQSGNDDFIIEENPEAPGFIDAAGIKSPGLASSPMIALYVRDIFSGITKLEKKGSFIGRRKPFIRFAELTTDEKRKLIAEDSSFGRIVCRCEQITEGEIIDAIRRPVGATTMDGIKRRVRAGMGRCQGGFCTTRVMEILAAETGRSMADIVKSTEDSRLITGNTKS